MPITAERPTGTPAAERAEQQVGRHGDQLFATLDQLEVPDGYRAEILGDEGIVMSPTPSGKHQHNVWRLRTALDPYLPSETRTEDHFEIRMDRTTRAVIPDLFVAPTEVLATDDHSIGPEHVLLASEVVSPGSKVQDRERKLAVYAQAQIPLYLLIDPLTGTVTLYSTPRDDGYIEDERVAFGKPLTLPEPFGTQLDTGIFTAY
ncbi:Uma2 family endonuclease [Nocardiopsis coralliicola]